MIKTILKKLTFYGLYRQYQINKEVKEFVERNIRLRQPLIDKYLPKHGIGAELGVLHGDFSPILLETTKAKELHLIDPWYFLEAEWDWADGNRSTVDAVVKILRQFKNEINNRRVFVHIQDDVKVLKDFPDNYFDWVYIDSSHAYEHTVEELCLLKSKVKADGIIGGDDWRTDENHWHHGVYKAVMEFTEKNKYEIIYADENSLQWFIRKSNA